MLPKNTTYEQWWNVMDTGQWENATSSGTFESPCVCLFKKCFLTAYHTNRQPTVNCYLLQFWHAGDVQLSGCQGTLNLYLQHMTRSHLEFSNVVSVKRTSCTTSVSTPHLRSPLQASALNNNRTAVHQNTGSTTNQQYQKFYITSQWETESPRNWSLFVNWRKREFVMAV